VINCSNCGKENQDHYKFCLGCGARLAGMPAAAPAPARAPGGTVVDPASHAQAAPQAAPAPRVGGTVVAADRPDPGPARAGGTVVAATTSETNTGPTPVRPGAGQATAQAAAPAYPQQPAYPQPSAQQPAYPQPPAHPQPLTTQPAYPPTTAGHNAPTEPSYGCPSCGMVNPPGFLFCGRCGSRLGPATGPSPAAAPIVTAPAAVAPAAKSGPSTVVTPVKKPGLRASMHLLREDGSEGGTLHLEDGPVPFGRDYGPPFDTDFYLNPRHCAFTVTPDGVRVDDLNATNGVFRKIEGSIELQHGDTFRVGQELLYYEDLPEPEVLPDGTERMGSPNPGYWGRISVLVEANRSCEAMPIVGAEFTVGRERGDLTFPTDGYVSSSHCRIVGDDSGVYLEDRGSSNGTYLRVRSGTVVPFGSLVLIGQQLFHIRTS